ncbi:hypothetical protein [Acetobacter thailandicus]|uniref:hypothetical protein n=1 Tax=Acetobacter thailandicus TaxID=1502842 RepID=UPI001BA4F739|nr:hypothetical protein [Acetobacter thailandicus]MBS1004715.1 hypothetical protein [Acetobacter thailandicus]
MADFFKNIFLFLKPVCNSVTVVCALLSTLYLVSSGFVKDAGVYKILDEIIREICFAIYVSIVMWLVFEFQKSHEEEKKWKMRLSEIGKHVFYAMFGRKLPEIYIDQVMLCSLNSKLYRKNFEARYYLYDNKLGNDNFIYIVSDVSFTISNVSNSSCEYPLTIVIPSPVEKKLVDYVKVTSFEIFSNSEGGISTPIEKNKTDKKFEELLEKGEDRIEYSVGGISIPPKSSISIKITMNIVKPANGSDFLEMMIPSDGMKISIVDSCKNKKKIDARSIHSESIIKREINGTNEIEFSIVKPILPHQGIYWWWANQPEK